MAQLPQDFEDTAGDPIIAEPGDSYTGQIVYAGLRFWTVKPEDFRVYPAYVQNLGDSVTHGEVTHERIADIKIKQRIGMYAEANLMPSSDEDAPSVKVVKSRMLRTRKPRFAGWSPGFSMTVTITRRFTRFYWHTTQKSCFQ